MITAILPLFYIVEKMSLFLAANVKSKKLFIFYCNRNEGPSDSGIVCFLLFHFMFYACLLCSCMTGQKCFLFFGIVSLALKSLSS